MATLELGQTIDRYRIDAPLGRGGMGEVYRAYDTRLRRSVALKVLRGDDDGAPGGGLTAALRTKLLREARAAAALRHPGIVTVFDVGEIGGTPYIAMELVEGTSLRAFVSAEGVALERKLRWLVEMAAALAAAHRANLIHRDVKPDNVMVGLDDTIKVLDFGIAKLDDAAPASAPASSAPAMPSERTGAGAIIGTPRYMSPEQSEGRPIDARSDQFAWGVIAYELLSGRHPRDTRPGFAARGGWSEAAAPFDDAALSIPREVEATVLRAIEREPPARFASMDDVVAALAPFAPNAVRVIVAPPTPPAAASIDRDAPTREAPPTLGARLADERAVVDPTGAARAPAASSSRAPWLFSAAVAAFAIAAITLSRRSPPPAVQPPVTTFASTPAPSASPAPPVSQAPSAPALPSVSSALVATSPPTAISTAPPPAPWHLIHQLTLHPGFGGGYTKAAFEAALSPRLASIDSCLHRLGARAEDVDGSININYDGIVDPMLNTTCIRGPMCSCLKQHAGATLPIGPSPDKTAGSLVVVLFAER